MTAQTQAQRNASYRARQREKVERMERALTNLVSLTRGDYSLLAEQVNKEAREALDPPALHIET